MKVSIERVSGSQVVLEVGLDANAVGEAIQKAFVKLVKTVNVPGFRRGKAPRSLFERYAGKQALYDEAVEQLAPASYLRAIDEAGLEPLDQPEVDILEFGEGQGLRYRATVLIKPEAKLNDYRSIAIPVEPVIVNEEAMQEVVSRLRESQAVLEPASADAELGPGMRATVEVRKLDNEGAAGPESEHTVDLTGTDALEGAWAQLVGARVGETRVIGVPVAAGHETESEEAPANSEERWAVTVTGLKHKRLPELDDDFVKTLGQEETVGELLARLRERMLRLSEERARRFQLEQIARWLLAQTEVDIPEVMVENRLEGMMGEYIAALEAQGVDLGRHLAATKHSVESLKDELRLQARQAVKLDLALDAVAREEKMELTGEDTQQLDRRLAASPAYHAWAEAGRRTRLRSAVLRSKAMDFLCQLAAENAALQATTTVSEEEDAL